MHRFLLTILLATLLSPVASAGELNALEPRPAPLLDSVDLDGGGVELDGYHGQVVLVNFWASWCAPCLKEMPSLIRLREAIDDSRLVIFAVNVEESAYRVRRVAKRYSFNFPLLLDRKGEAFRRWGSRVFPTSFLVDGEGRIRFRAMGPIEWDGHEAMEAINHLLGEL